MRFALFGPDFGGIVQRPLEEVISKAADLGFDGIEIGAARPHLSPLDHCKKSARKIKEMVESKGLVISNLAAYPDFCYPAFRQVEKELISLKAAMELAAAMDVQLVRTQIVSCLTFGPFPQTVASFAGAGSLMAQYHRGIEATREATKIAEDIGVTLFLDNHGFLTVLEHLKIVREINSPNLKISIDAGNCVAHGEDLIESARACGELLVHSHAKDCTPMGSTTISGLPTDSWSSRFWTFTTIGKGLVDWESYLKVLKEINYKGFLSIESHSPKFFMGIADYETPAKGLKFLRTLSEKVGI